MTTTVSGSQITFNDNTTQNTSAYGGGFAFRNRIINGDMRIDQRNAGAATANTINGYTLDRWAVNQSVTGKLTVQQSSIAPTGFSNSLLITSASAYTIVTSDYYVITQRIEGFNTSDLSFGTVNAQTVTLSFWVRSSLTGTFGGSLRNSADNRSYPFSYTISSANTWEQKTVTVTGDTTGTWIGATNGTGIGVNFGLGVGSTYSGTAGSWNGNNNLSATGATSVVGTNGATFYITGVQLEKGSTATSFDYRPYGTELALCQRYCLIGPAGAVGRWNSTTSAEAGYAFPIEMRVAPTVTHSANYDASNLGVAALTVTGTALSGSSNTRGTLLSLTSSGATSGGICGVRGAGAIFSAEL